LASALASGEDDSGCGVLDPGDERPDVRRWVETWLRVQRAWAWRPQEAAAALEGGVAPAALARDCGEPVDADRLALARAGARLVPLPAAAYPARIRRLADAAPVLAVQGDWQALHDPAVAIVGARAATAYGLEMARRLADGVARAGAVVVSGLARGVDAAAHGAALAAGGRTVAVQACGADRVYPPEHRALAARIAGRGAVASELPAGTPPLPGHFPLRNRLISALALAVVVVEARPRSGSLVTARHALDQGAEVLAVPGPVTAPTSEGPNRLISDGAKPALDAACVLQSAGLRVPGAPARDAAPQSAPSDPAARTVLAALGHAPATRDELGRKLGLGPERLAAALLPLELSGRVVEDRDGRLRVLRGR